MFLLLASQILVRQVLKCDTILLCRVSEFLTMGSKDFISSQEKRSE